MVLYLSSRMTTYRAAPLAHQLVRPRAVVVLKRLVNPWAGWQKFDEVIRVEHRHAFFPDHGGFDFGEMRITRWQLLLDHV